MKTILVIEDNHQVRKLIQDLLAGNNYKVFDASNGTDGIQIAIEKKPDLIICDIMMPGVDGYQVLKELIKENIVPFTPFIFLTAKSERDDFRVGMDLGADDYITKPFKVVTLLKAVELRLAKAETVRSVSPAPAEAVSNIKSVSTEAVSNLNNVPSEVVVKKEKLKETDNLLLTVNNKPLLIKVFDILCIKAQEEYTLIYLLSGQKLLVRKLMKQWEENLPDNIFLRIHRSTIINLNQIDKIEKWYNRSLVVYLKKTEEKFIISQRYTARVKSRLTV